MQRFFSSLLDFSRLVRVYQTAPVLVIINFFGTVTVPGDDELEVSDAEESKPKKTG